MFKWAGILVRIVDELRCYHRVGTVANALAHR